FPCPFAPPLYPTDRTRVWSEVVITQPTCAREQVLLLDRRSANCIKIWENDGRPSVNVIVREPVDPALGGPADEPDPDKNGGEAPKEREEFHLSPPSRSRYCRGRRPGPPS